MWEQIAGLVADMAGADGEPAKVAAKQCVQDVNYFYALHEEPLFRDETNTDYAAHHDVPPVMAE